MVGSSLVFNHGGGIPKTFFGEIQSFIPSLLYPMSETFGAGIAYFVIIYPLVHHHSYPAVIAIGDWPVTNDGSNLQRTTLLFSDESRTG